MNDVRYTTCYMCACRCGIRVRVEDGEVRYIDGNPNHPVNRGVICAKGAAGLRQHQSPARLRKPLKRVGPRGSGEFEEIEWEEALSLAGDWLGTVRETDPRRLAFFTGRDQSQSLTGFWATQFGTPNFAAHGGFCSVNMAAAGLYTVGGSFWEFGEPDWERTRYFLMFGVAEDHASNPIKIGLSQLKNRADTKFVSINPVRTGYSAIADEWLGIRPGTDGAFILALVHELLRTQRIDLDYLRRYTNATWLVRTAPGAADDGLILRDDAGAPLRWNENLGQAAADVSPADAALHGERDTDVGKAVPVFEVLARRYLDPAYGPEAAAQTCGIPAGVIRRIAREMAEAAFDHPIEIAQPWTDADGTEHSNTRGRPVSLHAMRGISAHTNGFHTCRALHVLQLLLGAIDCPGGFRYKPPYPQSIPPPARPAGKAGDVHPGQTLGGPPLGFVTGPEDLLVNPVGAPLRIDEAYSWKYPIAAHGLMHLVIRNAWRGEPGPIDVLFMYMANMSWNSAMNTAETMRMLTDRDETTGEYRIPKIIYSDAYDAEMVAYADLVLPDTTYLERWDCISLLDRPIGSPDAAGDAIRQPVVAPRRDVRPFQDVLIDLGARLALPAFVNDDGHPKYPGGYQDYLTNHERTPGSGPLAGWRGPDGERHGKGEPNPEQLARYIENQCYWSDEIPDQAKFYKFANRAYLAHARAMGWRADETPITMELYSETLQKFRLAARGHGEHQPPGAERDRVERYFDPLPFWYPPLGDSEGETYPLHAITQRPMAMYHAWGSQNAWLRQIHGRNALFMHVDTARDLGLDDGDYAWVESRNGRIKVPIQTMRGVNRQTVWTWNAIGKRRGAWGLDQDAPEGRKGFLLNHLIDDLMPGEGRRYANADPVTGQAAWFDLTVRITPAEDDARVSEPQFPVLPGAPKVARS